MFSKSWKSPNIWPTFARNFVTKNLQKAPNLATLVVILKMKLWLQSYQVKNYLEKFNQL